MKRIISNSVNRQIISSDITDTSDIKDSYIDKIMDSVTETIVKEPYNLTCVWNIYSDGFTFIVSSIVDHIVNEFTCPKKDLTGNFFRDKNYILDSIENIL